MKYVLVFLLSILLTSSDVPSEFIIQDFQTLTKYPIYQEPDLTLVLKDEGYIFSTIKDGYRYGPSIIQNEDGSYDMWTSSPGNNSTEWDYASYYHSDNGLLWTPRKIVLKPTPSTKDKHSVCDPGLIYFNDYYYLAYTSTDYTAGKGTYNSAFVARSKSPNGPFEKWNGEGWGGKPEPFIEYTGNLTDWGIGEVSFVIKDEQLYIYYTNISEYADDVYLAISDLSENWPANLEHYGYVSPRGGDSFEVAYSEKYHKFIAMTIKNRMSAGSKLELLSSEDGKEFEHEDFLKEGIEEYAHNLGFVKNYNGVIIDEDKMMLGYAYGEKWGKWNMKLIKIGIIEE